MYVYGAYSNLPHECRFESLPQHRVCVHACFLCSFFFFFLLFLLRLLLFVNAIFRNHNE